MEAAVGVHVFDKAVTFLVILAAVCQVFLGALGKIILIHKVVAGVVGWVNINHFDFAQIGFLQQLQHFQVIALNVQVFGIETAGGAILAHAFHHARTQRFGNGRIGQQHRLLFIRPGKLIPFILAIHHGSIDFLHQHIFINGTHHHTVFVHGFRHRIGKQRRQLLEIFISPVRRLHF